jgi:hypothetical protein
MSLGNNILTIMNLVKTMVKNQKQLRVTDLTKKLKKLLILDKVNLDNFFIFCPVDKKTIMQESRIPDLVQWRCIYYAIALISTEHYTKASELLGKDRTTVRHNIYTLIDLMETNYGPLVSKVNLIRNNSIHITQTRKCFPIEVYSFRPNIVNIQ